MDGKIILNLAMSIDGYIACEDGSFDWIQGDGDHTLNTEEGFDFSSFLDNIDIIVMGKRCYEQNFHLDYPNKKIYIATKEILEDYSNIHFINDNVSEIIYKERTNQKRIFLFGGGQLIDTFIKTDLIDEYIIGIIPIILGKGRPLFLSNNPIIPLHLKHLTISEGIPILQYSKRQ